MFINTSQKFADWFNMKCPGAPRQITSVDMESLKACELIHRHGFYLTAEDSKTVMGILKYEQWRFGLCLLIQNRNAFFLESPSFFKHPPPVFTDQSEGITLPAVIP
jgi:hypothetical protein